LNILSHLVPRPLPASAISSAALFRTIEATTPTLCLDEFENIEKENPEFRGVVNSGHLRRFANVVRTVGDDFAPRTFSTWCPMVIALIGKPWDTLRDRSIEITLTRRLKSELVDRWTEVRVDPALADLRRQAARFAADNAITLQGWDGYVPEALHDRAADNWRPLLAIADIVGGDWPKRARDAALTLSGGGAVEDEDAKVQFLTDMRALFDNRGPACDRLKTADILVELNELEERPWPEWGKQGKGLTPSSLARLAKPFGGRPKTMKFPEAAKGYERKSFEDAFNRYLPSSPPAPAPQAVTAVTGLRNKNFPGPSSVTDSKPVTEQQEEKQIGQQAGNAGYGRQAGEVARASDDGLDIPEFLRRKSLPNKACPGDVDDPEEWVIPTR
jgi:hypothetical protein